MRTCQVVGCDRPHCAKGWCKRHYYAKKIDGQIVVRPARPSLCLVDGCDVKHYALGYCYRHWSRVRKDGDPGPAGYLRVPGATAAERIYPRLVEDPASGCWLWEGARAHEGYGHVYVDNKLKGVHRWVYEDMVGDIPEGLVLDHLCVTPPCANPYHLEPVTPGINSSRVHQRRVAVA